MAETSKEEWLTEEFEMKVEKASITGNSLPLTLVEEMSIVYIKEEDAKIEGIIIRNNNILKIKYNFQSFYFFQATSPNDDDDPPLPEFKYSCDECEYSTSIRANLTTHMKRKQNKVLMYPCDHCEFSPLMLTQLKNHIKKKHEIPCAQCAFISNSNKDMKMHSKR